MKHLFICREYPPAAYLPGGIGTYVRQISVALAEAGETVHVIGHRWPGAPRLREVTHDGRLTVHRVSLDEPMRAPDGLAWTAPPGLPQQAMLHSRLPAQVFAWQAALLAERLIEDEGIDIVEAQEWEAPLVYLQARRAAGLGPQRRPPCVVHLHSSSEMIFQANGWSTEVADHAPALALEAQSIRWADAILAPSRFIADETAERLQLQGRPITVIPYPLLPGDAVARDASVWQAPAVCHVGRLELRKGMLEWAEALALASARQPDLQAHFAGGDTPLSVTGEGSVRQAMLRCLPASRRHRLVFHGNLDAAGMRRLQARCSLAVVPSRWENFPYACMEAMRSGLPVIVAPRGGTAEMIEAGRCGWVASSGTPQALAAALQSALATPAAQRRNMGAAAAERIAALCGIANVLAAQRAFRRSVVERAMQAPQAAPAPEQAAETSMGPVRVLAHPQLQLAPDLAARCSTAFAANPAWQGLTAWVLLDGEGMLLMPGAARLQADDGRPMPLLVLRQDLADALGLAADQAWPDAALSERLSKHAQVAPDWCGSYPGVLGRMPSAALGRVPAQPPYSALALAVLRHHMGLGPWLALCTPGYRRALALRAAGAVAARLTGRHRGRLAAAASEAPASAVPLPVAAPPECLPPMQTGLVSVVVAAYNAQATLSQTLASVLAQSYERLELIVVDDGSTDATAAIVEALAALDGRVRLVRQSNAGVAAARNQGLRLARGEFIAPLDADDLWAPSKLARMVARLQEAGPDAGFAYCWWVVVDAEGCVLDRSPHWREEGSVLRQLAEVNFVGCASIPVFRRSALLRGGPGLGYDARLRDLDAQGCEDWDLLLRVAQVRQVVCVPEVLVAYRRHGGSMSSGCAAMWRSGQLVLAELGRRQPDWPPSVCAAGLGQFALHLAGVAFWSGRPLEALGWILRSRSPVTVLAILPALVRILLRGPAAPMPVRLDPRQGFDAAGLPPPLMPYAQIHQRRWRRRAMATEAAT